MFSDRAPPGLPETIGRCRVPARNRCHAHGYSLQLSWASTGVSIVAGVAIATTGTFFYFSTSSNGSSSLRLTIVEERDGGIEPDQWRQRPTPGEGRKRLRPKNNRGYAILHGLAVSGWYPQVTAGGN
ncbi:hypothetical protein RPHASCH2410_CH07425 [Rhizobium phaseoli Ch24-10]|nr:hypothetical protein RPHASCH2410_CH07425 [Rhizobium phaseoli Ch24-10]